MHRLGRAHLWPGRVRARWTTNEIPLRDIATLTISIDQQWLVALNRLSSIARRVQRKVVIVRLDMQSSTETGLRLHLLHELGEAK